MNAILHYILKGLYTVTARTYYSNISVLHLEKVPLNKPLLIAINHSNAFWDGVLVGLHTKQKVWFLARGDVFNKPAAAKILNAIGIAPIYRMQEGIENIEKNKAVFERCYQILGQNQSIAIFPEGNCERESKLRPLKKGTSRIAHGALSSFPAGKELYIVCAGLNYDDPDTMNSSVLLHFNDPIRVNDYIQASEVLDSKAAMKLTKTVESAMDAVMYNVHDHQNHALFHFIKRNFLALLTGNNKSPQHEFQQVKALSDKINQTDSSALKAAVEPYMQALQRKGLREKYVYQFLIQSRVFSQYILFLLLLIPALPGLLFNSWPYALAYRTAKKTVKKAEFFSSVNIGAAGLLYFVWYIILLIITSLLLSAIKALMLIVALHFSGVVSLHFMSTFRGIRGHRKLMALNKKEKEALLQNRAQCIEGIQKFVQS